MARIDMPEGANVAVPGQYSLIQAALSNKGNPTSGGFNNLMVVEQNQPVRIVDGGGNVIFEGIGPDAARQAVAIGQGISEDQGNKAAYKIQTVPVGSSNFKTIATEKVNKSAIGAIADIALPVVGTILAGPLGAAAGSATSSIAQGRSIGDILLRAAIAGGTSALVPGGESAAGAASQGAGQVVGQAAGQAAGQAVGQAAGQAAGDIVVNAILPSLGSQILGGAAGGLASSFVPSFFDSAQLSNVAPTQPQPAPAPSVSDIIVTAPTAVSPSIPSAVVPGITSGVLGGITTPSVSQPAQTQQPTQLDDIVVTAPTNLLPAAYLTPAAIAAAAAANAAGATTSAADLAASRTSMTPEEMAAVNAGAGGGGLLAGLTKNMGLLDYLTLGSLAGSALGSIAGGGGSGSGTGTPYVSPFGAGPAFGAGTDMRATPAIEDYERYGFGPEATFFRPEYNRLVSGASQPKSTAMPTYTPLLNG